MSFIRQFIPGFGEGYGGPGPLLVAVTFWGVFNLSLVGTVLWPEWLPPKTQTTLWAITAAIWVVSVIWASKRAATRSTCEASPDATSPDQFPDLLELYLKGQWEVLRAKLPRYLQGHPHDVEARLLWASTLRRLGEVADARRQLELVRQSDTAGRWILEVHREKGLLRELERDLSAGAEAAEDSETAGPEQIPVGLRSAQAQAA